MEDGELYYFHPSTGISNLARKPSENYLKVSSESYPLYSWNGEYVGYIKKEELVFVGTRPWAGYFSQCSDERGIIPWKFSIKDGSIGVTGMEGDFIFEMSYTVFPVFDALRHEYLGYIKESIFIPKTYGGGVL